MNNANTTRRKIQAHLWMWQFRVKDRADTAPYDLLVNGKWRVRIVESDEANAITLRMLKDCDVLAVYIPKTQQRLYSRGQVEGEYRKFTEYQKTPRLIFNE